MTIHYNITTFEDRVSPLESYLSGYPTTPQYDLWVPYHIVNIACAYLFMIFVYVFNKVYVYHR